MKIVEYSDIPLGNSAGGGNTYVMSVARELESLGNNVFISDGHNRPRLFSNRYMTKIFKDADIHHFQEPSVGFPIAFIKRVSPRNCVLTFHAPVSNHLFRTLYSPFMRFISSKTSLVLTTTYRNAKVLSANGVNATVVPLWADSFFKPSCENGNDRKRYVLSVCVVDRFHSYKNYAMISKLAKTLKQKLNVDLVHVGPRYFNLPCVKHVGVVNRFQLRELYQNAIALVLPSIGPYEGFGLVAVESLACGTPILVSDECGVSDFLQGIFVSPLESFEKRVMSMTEELLKEPQDLIDKAKSQSLKFSYSNCTKTARLVIQSAK